MAYKPNELANLLTSISLVIVTLALAMQAQPVVAQPIADSLLQTGNVYLRQRTYEEAIVHYETALEIAEDPILIGNIFHNAGVAHFQLEQYVKSLELYNAALTYYQNSSNDTLVASTNKNVGTAYLRLGLYDKAQDHLFEASKLYKRLGIEQYSAATYNTLGNLFKRLEDYTRAKDYHHRALELRQKLGNMRLVAASMNNLGDTYQEEGLYDSAIYYLRLALAIKKDLSQTGSLANTYLNLGLVGEALSDWPLASQYLDSALVLYDSLERPASLGYTYVALVKVHWSWGKSDNVETWLNMALEAADSLKNIDLQHEVYKVAAEYYEDRANTMDSFAVMKKAFDYANLAAVSQRGLLDEEKQRSIVTANIKYEVAQKEALLLQQEKDILQQSNANLRLRAIALALGVFVLGALVVAIQQKRNAALKGALASQKTRLMREMHHRVKNNLNTLGAMVKMQLRSIKEPFAHKSLEDVKFRLSAMNLVHVMLYDNADEELAEIGVHAYLEKLIKQVHSSYTPRGKKVDLQIELGVHTIEATQAIAIGLATNEVLTNCFKYAVPSTTAPKIVIRGEQTENLYSLSITDNGPGFDEDKVKDKQSVGLTIIDDYAYELEAQYRFEFNEGTSFIMDIPYKTKSGA